MQNDFEEFTESAFRGLIRKLKARNYRFEKVGSPGAGRHVLWRHDVDFSMHRAMALARIESEEGVASTYFINPRNDFYSILEPEIIDLAMQMQALGHEIGLHFDGGAQGVDVWSLDKLQAAVTREKEILETVLGLTVNSVSWHNPDTSNLIEFVEETIGGLVNAYAESLRKRYVYCSDSNGYWRFKPMHEVIDEGHDRLYLLTHPEWWTPRPLPPRARIERCATGRAAAVMRRYDSLFVGSGRKNLK